MALSCHVMCYCHAAFLFRVPTWGLVFFIDSQGKVRGDLSGSNCGKVKVMGSLTTDVRVGSP